MALEESDGRELGVEQGVHLRAVGNGIHCDTTKRASQRLAHTKRGFPCITEVGINPLIPQPCEPRTRLVTVDADSTRLGRVVGGLSVIDSTGLDATRLGRVVSRADCFCFQRLAV